MYRKQQPQQETCFIPGSLSDYVPEDHILKRVNAVLDLRWLEAEVRDLYAAEGRPCIAPEQALRLILAGFFDGIVQDRKLLREAQVNLAYRWFAGYELGDALPDHSSLTRIRQRWGAARFKKIFKRSVAQCQQAGLAPGEMLHTDASLIRADVSWESLVEAHVEQVLAENPPLAEETTAVAQTAARPEAKAPATKGKAGKRKKVSTTDPEASLTTSCKRQRMEPCYKQHTVVDDHAGVIVDLQVTTGEANEGQQLLEQLARVEETLGVRPRTVTADRGYASADNYAALEELGVEAVIPPAPERAPHRGMPLARFSYDARHQLVRCPAGKWLARKGRGKGGWHYRARAADCRGCRLRAQCVPPSAQARSVLIKDGYCALLRARRRKQQGWNAATQEAYRRHRWRAEGAHGEAKSQHGLRRAARRGLDNVAIQAYLTATVMNLKRLAAHAGRALRTFFGDPGGGFSPRAVRAARWGWLSEIKLLGRFIGGQLSYKGGTFSTAPLSPGFTMFANQLYNPDSPAK